MKNEWTLDGGRVRRIMRDDFRKRIQGQIMKDLGYQAQEFGTREPLKCF